MWAEWKAIFRPWNLCIPIDSALSVKISPILYIGVHQNWRRLIADTPELEGARLHDLRHTFATERVGLMGIEELRALMGHESIMTTLRYQKVTSARAETVAQSALKKLATGAIKT